MLTYASNAFEIKYICETYFNITTQTQRAIKMKIYYIIYNTCAWGLAAAGQAAANSNVMRAIQATSLGDCPALHL